MSKFKLNNIFYYFIFCLIIMIIFIFIYEKQTDITIQERMKYYSSILEVNVWNYDIEGTKKIARVIIQSNDIKSLTIIGKPHDYVFSENYEEPYRNFFEKFLFDLNLIRILNYEENIYFENRDILIGIINASWINRNIYLYFGFLMFLIATEISIFTYIKLLNKKKELNINNLKLIKENELRKKAENEIQVINNYLENQVEKRTKSLYETNNSLKEEIKERKNIEKKLQENNESLESLNEQLTAMNEELEALYNEQATLTNEFEKIIYLSSHLIDSAIKNDEKFLSNILDYSLSLIKEADSGTVAIIEDKNLRFIDAKGHNKVQLKKIQIPNNVISLETENKIINHNLFLKNIINDDEKFNSKHKMLEEAFLPIKESLVISFETPQGKSLGIISLDITKEKMNFSKESKKLSEAFASLASAFLTIRKYLLMEEKISEATILSMIKMLEIYDIYTQGHSKRVADISIKLGLELNMGTEELSILHWTGIIHDIGKILVPKTVLNKEGRLTDEEFLTIKKHPVWGYDVLKNSDLTKEMAKYVLHHHERWDGKGYPDKLKEKEIPLISRILTIADSFDAMTSDRSYRKKMSTADALEEIKVNAGKQFDPELSEIFIKSYKNNKMEG